MGDGEDIQGGRSKSARKTVTIQAVIYGDSLREEYETRQLKRSMYLDLQE